MDEKKKKTEKRAFSRRDMLTGSAALLMTGVVSGAVGAYAAVNPDIKEEATAPPPLPWKWVKLDPLEVGRRAYKNYVSKGGCGATTYLAFVSLLREKVGYPWTTLPDMMMVHAGAGYAGHGTLCGTLASASLILNLVTFDQKSATFQQMIDRLFWWYAKQEFPSDRFDDIAEIQGQIKVKAMSPLCHTSVSKWILTAGEEVTSKAKKERCAKVAGEVAYITTHALNEYFDGKWIPPTWEPSEEIKHCLSCHGPDDKAHSNEGMNNQLGHMECLMCHDDHTL